MNSIEHCTIWLQPTSDRSRYDKLQQSYVGPSGGVPRRIRNAAFYKQSFRMSGGFEVIKFWTVSESQLNCEILEAIFRCHWRRKLNKQRRCFNHSPPNWKPNWFSGKYIFYLVLISVTFPLPFRLSCQRHGLFQLNGTYRGKNYENTWFIVSNMY